MSYWWPEVVSPIESRQFSVRRPQSMIVVRASTNPAFVKILERVSEPELSEHDGKEFA